MLRQKAISFIAPVFAVIALLIASTSPSFAQAGNQSTIGALGNLFGALAQAGAKAKAEKGWAQVNPQMTQCVNTMLSGKNINVDQLVAAGMAPNDQRIAPIIAACNQFLNSKPRTNFACTVQNAKGQQVATTCNESYAKEVNGSLVALSGDDVLRAAANGDKLVAANFETVEAQNARLAEEQRQAAVERQRFLASPEGKRQVAAEAAQARQAEAARRQEAARAAAEQARRPRGFYVVCAGEGDSSRFNLHTVNCDSPHSVVEGFKWAYNLIRTFPASDDQDRINRAQLSRLCSEKMSDYIDMGDRNSAFLVRRDYIETMLWYCNQTIREFNGPSAVATSGKRR